MVMLPSDRKIVRFEPQGRQALLLLHPAAAGSSPCRLGCLNGLQIQGILFINNNCNIMLEKL